MEVESYATGSNLSTRRPCDTFRVRGGDQGPLSERLNTASHRVEIVKFLPRIRVTSQKDKGRSREGSGTALGGSETDRSASPQTRSSLRPRTDANHKRAAMSWHTGEPVTGHRGRVQNERMKKAH